MSVGVFKKIEKLVNGITVVKKKESFLLHIVKDEEESVSEIKGRIIQIKTGAVGYFEKIEQLEEIISEFLKIERISKTNLKK